MNFLIAAGLIIMFLLNPALMIVGGAFWLYYKAIKYYATASSERNPIGFEHINYSAPAFTFKPETTPVNYFPHDSAEGIDFQSHGFRREGERRTFLTPEEEKQFRIIIEGFNKQ